MMHLKPPIWYKFTIFWPVMYVGKDCIHCKLLEYGDNIPHTCSAFRRTPNPSLQSLNWSPEY